MTDIDRLTLVIGCLGLLILGKMPEGDVSKWSFPHLTFDLLVNGILLLGVLIPIWHIIGFGGF